MKIGPLTTVDYDEATQQITTESHHVVIQDPDMVTTGDGMLIQLRKDDAPRPSGSSSGFQGAERLDLLKNVHVVMRDVGKSGIMPGSTPDKTATQGSRPSGDVAGKDEKTRRRRAGRADAAGPAVRLEDAGLSAQAAVAGGIGPPAPPAPTLVQFDRNVVVLRGQLDDRPDQLTCDTLKLSMVPGEKPPQNEHPCQPSPDQARHRWPLARPRHPPT